MQTHFVRTKAAYHKKLASPVESLTCQAIPDDRLVTEKDVYATLNDACRKHGERRPNHKNFHIILASLSEKGFIKRVDGDQLDRFLVAI